jgi:hypothetical protein
MPSKGLRLTLIVAGLTSESKGEKMDKKCSNCSAKIDHFGFTPDDLRIIMSANQTEAIAHAKTIGGKCEHCGKVCCSICYQNNQPNKYTCPNCGGKIMSFQ